MLLDLLAKGYIDKEDLLLKNYKKLGLTENQVVMLLLIMRLSDQVLTPKEISKYTNLSLKEVEQELDALINQKLIKVTSKSIDLSGLFIKLVQVLEDDINLDNNDLIRGLNGIFTTKLSVEDVNYLQETILSKFSKEEVLVLARQTKAKTFKDFAKELESSKNKKVKPITKINWLQ